MGNWKIEIKGHGIHHNARHDDADTMGVDFIRQLQAAGHRVDGAALTLTDPNYEAPGESTDLLAPAVAQPASHE